MNAMSIWLLAASTALLLTGCDNNKPSVSQGGPTSQEQHQSAPAQAETASPPRTEIAVLATGLRIPWAIERHNGVFYVSERGGTVAAISDRGVTRKPVRISKTLRAIGEGGFLGFVLMPDFDKSRSAVAYHTYEQDGAVYNRIVLLKENEEEWTETAALLEGIPGSDNHNGGRLAIGPDGLLYATTGDTYKEDLAQNTDTLAGKILRLKLDGGVPEDNPIPGSYLYSYGHRNPQGLAWDANGQLYATEHGPSGNPGGHDEINLIKPGANYGWPLVIGDQTSPGTEPPLYHTGDEAIAPSGAAFDDSGRLLVAGLRGEKLFSFDPAGGELSGRLSGEGRIRDVKVYDGYVYVITNNTDGRGRPAAEDDRLIRIKF